MNEPRGWNVGGLCFCTCDVAGLDSNGKLWRGMVSAGGTAEVVLGGFRLGATIRVRLRQFRTNTGHDCTEVPLMVTDRIRPIGGG